MSRTTIKGNDNYKYEFLLFSNATCGIKQHFHPKYEETIAKDVLFFQWEHKIGHGVNKLILHTDEFLI